MKRNLFLIAFILTCLLGYSQSYEVNMQGTILKKTKIDSKQIPMGTSFKIKNLRHDVSKASEDVNKEGYWLDTNIGSIELNDKIEELIGLEVTSPQQLWDSLMITRVIPEIVLKKGFQTERRDEMEKDALDYIAKIKSMGREFNDPYLETYIYSLISKIAPKTMIDGRPGNINILLENNPDMNAGMYPNGTLIINTGLLSALKSEEELVGVLSHEIAHFVLDHSIDNVNKAIMRKKRAEFWSALATGLTAVAEGVAAAKTDYIPGAGTLAMAVLSNEISKKVIDRLGMNYNHKQENEADLYACKILELLGYSKVGLPTALYRMKQQMDGERKKCMYFTSYTHPALVERINNNGGAMPSKISHDFEKKISFTISETALSKYYDRRFKQALDYVNINIENNVAIVSDYIVKAKCYLALYADNIHIVDAINLLNKAKELESNNLEIYKSEIIAYLKLDNQSQSVTLLKEYDNMLVQNLDSLVASKNGDHWLNNYNYLLKEREWVKNMLIKLNGMISHSAA